MTLELFLIEREVTNYETGVTMKGITSSGICEICETLRYAMLCWIVATLKSKVHNLKAEIFFFKLPLLSIYRYKSRYETDKFNVICCIPFLNLDRLIAFNAVPKLFSERTSQI